MPEPVVNYVNSVKDKNNRTYEIWDSGARDLISSLSSSKSEVKSQAGAHLSEVRIANNLFDTINGVEVIKNTAGYEISYTYQNSTNPAVVSDKRNFHTQFGKWHSKHASDDARSVVISYIDSNNTPQRHLYIMGVVEVDGSSSGATVNGKLQFDIPSYDGTKYIHVCDTFTYLGTTSEDGTNDTHTITYSEGRYDDRLMLTAIPVLSTSLEAFAATLPLGVHHCFYNSEDYASDAPLNVHAFVDIVKYSENTGDMIFRPVSVAYKDKIYRRVLLSGTWGEWVEFSAGGNSVDKYEIDLTVNVVGSTSTPTFTKINGYTAESDIIAQLHNLYLDLQAGKHPVITFNYFTNRESNTISTLCPVSASAVNEHHICFVWEWSVPTTSTADRIPATRYVNQLLTAHDGTSSNRFTYRTYTLT